MKKVLLTIDGMHCGACVRRVTQALEGVAGVQVEAVEVGSARVRLDPSEVEPEQVVKAVNGIGFQAKIADNPA